MRQTKFFKILALLLCMSGIKAFAYDFAVENAYGDMIYYVKLNDTELAVTYQTRITGGFLIKIESDYEGDLVIPEKVVYDGTVYTVTQIGERAFCDCSGLTSITLPKSIKRMDCLKDSNGNSTFKGCTNLTAINITDIASWCGIYFGTNSTYFCNPLSTGAKLYLNGVLVKDLIIPDGVTTISYGAFKDCNQIASVKIPRSVTTIKERAFYGCALTSVTIGAGVTSIGAYSLYNDNLLTVTSEIEVPFDCNAFSSNTQRNGTLYIPSGTKDYYTRFDGWRQFLNIVEKEPESQILSGDINGDKVVNGTDIVALVSIIMGQQTQSTVADLNGDGQINGTDIVKLVSIILNSNN